MKSRMMIVVENIEGLRENYDNIVEKYNIYSYVSRVLLEEIIDQNYTVSTSFSHAMFVEKCLKLEGYDSKLLELRQ